MSSAVHVCGLDVVAYARTLVGVKYHHQGRNPVHGIDCVGLLVATAEHFGIPYIDLRTYTERPKAADLLRCIEHSCDRLPADAPHEPGAVALFWFRGPDHPQHAAILDGTGRMIHTYRTVNRVVDMAMSDGWLKRLHSTWRLR